MHGGFVSGLLATVLLGCAACAGSEEEADRAALPSIFRKLLPLHEELGPPKPGDWLAAHYEPGQTFRQYVRSRPVKPDRKRRVIYVQPLGPFSESQRKITDRLLQSHGAGEVARVLRKVARNTSRRVSLIEPTDGYFFGLGTGRSIAQKMALTRSFWKRGS